MRNISMLPTLIVLFWSTCFALWLWRMRARALARREALREVGQAFERAAAHFAEAERLALESQAAVDEAQATLKKAYGKKQREPHLHPSVITSIAPKLD